MPGALAVSDMYTSHMLHAHVNFFIKNDPGTRSDCFEFCLTWRLQTNELCATTCVPHAGDSPRRVDDTVARVFPAVAAAPMPLWRSCN